MTLKSNVESVVNIFILSSQQTLKNGENFKTEPTEVLQNYNCTLPFCRKCEFQLKSNWAKLRTPQ